MSPTRTNTAAAARRPHSRHIIRMNMHKIQMFAVLLVSLSLSPPLVSSFGWLKLNTLSERLMGSRPEWTTSTDESSRRGTSNSPQQRQQQHSYSHSFRHQPCFDTNTSPYRSSSSSSSLRSTKQDLDKMMDFMNQEPSSLLGDRDSDPLAPLDPDTMDLLNCIVQAADGRKALDILALKVHHVSTLTSVLVILSGNSRPQNQAIAAAIRNDVQDQFQQRPGGSGIPEGSAESGWMLLDYGTVMVHIMTPKSRLFYNVQGQWMQKGAQEMDVSHMLVGPPPASSSSSSSSLQEPQEPAPEDDPFWS